MRASPQLVNVLYFVLQVKHSALLNTSTCSKLNFTHICYTGWERLTKIPCSMWSSVQGKDEMLGRSVFSPLVKLNSGEAETPRLLWRSIIQKGQKAGEALVAAELILKNKVGHKSTKKKRILKHYTEKCIVLIYNSKWILWSCDLVTILIIFFIPHFPPD